MLYDGLKQFQGPALLARNNKTFADKDFDSLSSIGDSKKRHDAAATGKFGQGFNSVGGVAFLTQRSHTDMGSVLSLD